MPGEIIYWDSCIFLAHYKQESNKPVNALNHIRQMETLVIKGELKMVTSSISYIEVLDQHLEEEQIVHFKKLMSNKVKHTTVLDPDLGIMEQARELRSRVMRTEILGKKRSFSVPDAIHIATAIRSRADFFYTFDGMKPTADNEKWWKLLDLKEVISEVNIMQPDVSLVNQAESRREQGLLPLDE